MRCSMSLLTLVPCRVYALLLLFVGAVVILSAQLYIVRLFNQRNDKYFSGEKDEGREGAVSIASSSDRCLANTDNILLCITCYGEGRLEMVSQIMKSMVEVHKLINRVDIILHLTHLPEIQANFFSARGLNVTTYVAEPGSLKEVRKKGVRKRGDYHFSGKCRYDFRKAVRHDYSYFLFSENDMNITLNHLEVLCREFKFLRGHKFEGKQLKPGLLRYEGENYSLTDFWTSRSNTNKVISIEGKLYFLPYTPYEALYFFPVDVFIDLVELHKERKNYDLFAQRIIWEGKLVREFHAGLWFKDFTAKVVPLEGLENFLVHHMTENYMKKEEIQLLTLNQLRDEIAVMKKTEGFL